MVRATFRIRSRHGSESDKRSMAVRNRLYAGGVGLSKAVDEPLVHLSIAVDSRTIAEALGLYGTCFDHALTNLSRGLTGLTLGDVLEGYWCDLALNVDTVHQRAADLVEVFLYLSGRTHTVMRRIAVVATRTRIH